MTKVNKQLDVPPPGFPMAETEQFQQRVVKATAVEFRRATKDSSSPNLAWQRVLGPGWQLSAAMGLWLTLTIEDRRELTVRYLGLAPLPPELKDQIRAAVASAVRRE